MNKKNIIDCFWSKRKSDSTDNNKVYKCIKNYGWYIIKMSLNSFGQLPLSYV